MRLVVIIPNWNGKSYLAESLGSLNKMASKAEIVVVDNNSSDGSQALIKKDFPNVTLIELPQNAGFTGGVNRGISYALDANAEFIALFNNDAIADKDWLNCLVTTAEHQPTAGIVTGKFLSIDGKTIDSTGEQYSNWGFPFPRGRGEIDKGQYDKQHWVFGATGGASLYRAAMLKQTGLFDQDFFAYYEDDDMSFRAQLLGWKVYYEPRAIARHHGGSTSATIGGFARYHSFKNFAYVYTKNMPGWLYWKYLPKFLMGFFLIIANCLYRGQINPLLRGLGAVIITLPKMFMKRRSIQSNRRATIDYVDSLLYPSLPPTQKMLLNIRRKLVGGRLR